MGNKDQNKFEEFAAHFHDKKENGQSVSVSNNTDFKVTQKIYSLREKVNLLSQFTPVEDAWRKCEWRLKDKNFFLIVWNFRYIRYAAIFIGLITLAGLGGIILFHSPQDNTEENFTEIITTTGEMKEVLLPDGSKVWIGANSVLKYAIAFGQENREIYFNGEAMFDVKKDSMLSFQVYLNNANITVHGTKFLVTDYSKIHKNEVVLLEGKIKYHLKNLSYIMVPGERVTSNRFTKRIIKDRVEVENYKEWINGKIFLDNKGLDDLSFLLEQWYDVKFAFSDESLKKYKFTGIIENTESLDYNLNKISLTNKVKFKKNGHRITIMNR